MGLYRRDRTWWLTFTHNGKRVTTSTKLTDRRLAERWAVSYQAEVQGGRFDPFRPTQDVYVSSVLTRYSKLHLRVNRPASYKDRTSTFKFLRAFFWKTPVMRVRSRIDEYKAWRKQTVKAATVNREITFLKAACSKAVEWEMIPDNPMRGYRMEKENNRRTRFLEDSEFFRLVNAAHPDLAPILIMARYTGMRQGEILNLQWSDVDLKRGFAHLRQTKSGESREVPLSTVVVDMLSKTLISERQGYIFRHISGDPIRDKKIPADGTAKLYARGWLMHEFRKAVTRAGLADTDVVFHTLRHTFGSHAAMRGVDVQTIAAVLGHKTLRMTQRYSHLSSPHLKASVELAAPRKPQPTATILLQSDQNPAGNSDLTETPKTKIPPDIEGILMSKKWRPQRESNPCYHLERVVT